MALIPTTQVNVSPDDYKRKMAYALMMQGASAEPIQHWTQGLARLAQAGIGGYEMYQDEQKQKKDEADATAAYLKYLQPQGGTPAPAANPAASPVVAALGKPAPMPSAGPVMPSAKVWGDKEAEDAGLYEKPTKVASLGSVPLPAPRPVATALAQPPQEVAPPSPTDTQMSDAKAKIAQLLQSPNRAERMLGKSLAEATITNQLTGDKPTDEMREYELYRKQGGKDSFFDFKANLKKAGATKVETNVGGGSDKQIFDELAERTKEARQTAAGLTALREAKNALGGGIIGGQFADEKLALAKIAASLGADSSKVENTETFRAAIAPQVAAVLKSTVGTANISNTDREFAEKAAGGSIKLDPRSIGRLMDIMERASVGRLEGHQKLLEKVYPDAEKFGRERALFGVDMPAMPPAPPAAAPDVNALKKKYNLD